MPELPIFEISGSGTSSGQIQAPTPTPPHSHPRRPPNHTHRPPPCPLLHFLVVSVVEPVKMSRHRVIYGF